MVLYFGLCLGFLVGFFLFLQKQMCYSTSLLLSLSLSLIQIMPPTPQFHWKRSWIGCRWWLIFQDLNSHNLWNENKWKIFGKYTGLSFLKGSEDYTNMSACYLYSTFRHLTTSIVCCFPSCSPLWMGVGMGYQPCFTHKAPFLASHKSAQAFEHSEAENDAQKHCIVKWSPPPHPHWTKSNNQLLFFSIF